MWRLRHGEGLVSAGPQLAVIMIGSNDLTYASLEVALPPVLYPPPPPNIPSPPQLTPAGRRPPLPSPPPHGAASDPEGLLPTLVKV